LAENAQYVRPAGFLILLLITPTALGLQVVTSKAVDMGFMSTFYEIGTLSESFCPAEKLTLPPAADQVLEFNVLTTSGGLVTANFVENRM